MAIYHCSVKTISRSTGSSAVNSAAYRSGENLYDQKVEKTFFYSGKALDVMHKEIMAPENAPDWVYDREKLWNNVEAGERRKDSQLAREIEISLPREFSTDQNIALVQEYVQRELVDKGMVADVCLHYGRRGDSYNPHAHIMLTMRDIDENGFGKKNTQWNSRDQLCQWRESWADLTNKHLALNGFEKTIDHRSLVDQGIELIPNNIELPSDAKDRLTEKRDRQVAIMRENGERLIKEPEIVLSAITKMQSTFTERDIARYLNSRTADQAQFQLVFDKVKTHVDLVRLAEVESKSKEGCGKEYIYTTREMLDLERKLFKDAKELKNINGFEVKNSEIKDRIEKRNEDGKALSAEQRAGLEYICQDKAMRCIVGYAGTGKTHMLSVAKDIWEESGYRVRGATLSGIAAQGLQEGSGIESKTVARQLIDWENGRGLLSNTDILVVDEAGMLGVRDVSRLVKEVSDRGAKIVGDPQQLQAIEAGAAFRGIVEREGYLEMADIRRQEAAWQKEATKQFAVGNVKEGLSIYNEAGKMHSFDTKERAMSFIVKDWTRDRMEGTASSIMLAFKREDVRALNDCARSQLKFSGEIDDGICVSTNNGEREFSKGDRIYFLRNDNGLNVKNGTLGIVESINDQGDIRVLVKEAAGDREVSFNAKDYSYIDHGYAATIHKSQGVTVDQSYVLATKGMNQHLAYVGMSRHVENVNLYWSKDEFQNYASLENHLSREAKKDNALDYVKTAKEFADTRGIVSTYKDILVKVNKMFVDFKDKITNVVQNFGQSKEVLSRLEERHLFNLEVKDFEMIHGNSITRDLKLGEELNYVGNKKFRDKEYGLFQGENNISKIMPIENCYNLRITDNAIISKNRDGTFVAGPTEETIWQRNVNDLSKEYGKEVTHTIDSGDMGRCRGFVGRGRESYLIMEQYDKVALINTKDCNDNLRKGEYVKIEDRERYDAISDKSRTELKAVHDKDTQRTMEREAEMNKQRERSKGMDMEIDF